jgi:hypothetical protein
MTPDLETGTQKNDLLGPSPRKRLAGFLDGTWNTINHNTNVWRLKSLLATKGDDAVEQLSYYSNGVGTTFGERLRGGMFGYGLNDEIIRAYEWLIDHYNCGDELFLFGFSRGAYSHFPHPTPSALALHPRADNPRALGAAEGEQNGICAGRALDTEIFPSYPYRLPGGLGHRRRAWAAIWKPPDIGQGRHAVPQHRSPRERAGVAPLR